MNLTSKDFIALEEKYAAQNYHPLPVVVNKAERIYVWDVEGNKYMDMLSGYSALNQGHRHPKIISALIDQASKVTLTSRAFHSDQHGLLVEYINGLTGKDKSLIMSSGAEAVETAIKMSRKWGHEKKGIADGDQEIIVCKNNFHGRTTTIISFSTEEQYRKGFGPFTPGFKIVDFGDIDQFKKAINENTVAFMVEPIQGEGGIIFPPEGYLEEAFKVCKENNVLFMADEIQTGLGRTGKLFASQHYGITPDVYIVGKAMGGGVMPVSAVMANKEIMDVFNPGDHGSTFGANPLASAVAHAALKVIVEDNLSARSHELGEYFMQGLKDLNFPFTKEIRGKGLFIGLEVNGDARPYCEKLLGVGILCKETHETTIRFAPPLIIEKEEIDDALSRIKKALS